MYPRSANAIYYFVLHLNLHLSCKCNYKTMILLKKIAKQLVLERSQELIEKLQK